MDKRTIQFTAQRVIYDTSAPVSTVCARLDEELHRSEDGTSVINVMNSSKSREELESGIQGITRGHDFMFFGAIKHHDWLNAWTGNTTNPVPEIHVYTLGNPLIAQTMLRHELATGLHVPPRILVLEKEDRSGTLVVYDLPSSIISPGLSGRVNEELKKAAEGLDEKLERLVTKVTRS
ncbi:hypothetical protein CERSUDRAFT_115892 [Gelatoporia subvermispora B]|uniref:DUF302 domain-containing protein n=1 Tax=Ceriporiopsis subvermispora (strain B) TaxID=914234 RepID=M2QFY6_CERS8|nr:hypothetical protein CERSUDRAFT_115892 [Gelatoporia subvermispora B]